MVFSFEDKSEWASEMEMVNAARKRTPWQMARLMLWGIETYCHNRDEIASLYDELSEQLEVSRKTLQNYASVARRFTPDRVRERLEIGHHIAVVAMPEEIADYWLSQAEAHGWSAQRLRQEIRIAAQTPSEEEEDSDPDMMGIVLQTLSRYGINAVGDEHTLSMGFPDGKFVVVNSTTNLQWSLTP